MVNDKDYVNMASLSSTNNYYANSVKSRVLAAGSLGPNASINYSLRLWMDEDTPLTSEAMNKSFRSKVVVVATPTKSFDFDFTGGALRNAVSNHQRLVEFQSTNPCHCKL